MENVDDFAGGLALVDGVELGWWHIGSFLFWLKVLVRMMAQWFDYALVWNREELYGCEVVQCWVVGVVCCGVCLADELDLATPLRARYAAA